MLIQRCFNFIFHLGKLHMPRSACAHMYPIALKIGFNIWAIFPDSINGKTDSCIYSANMMRDMTVKKFHFYFFIFV